MNRTYFALALLVAGALGGGLIVTQIPHHGVEDAGPQELAQDAWYRIEPRELAEHLVVRGNVTRDEPSSIRSPASGVVTAVGIVAFGSPLVELSGTPLFLLNGTFPGYRDLHPTLSGPDVEQLNLALAALGHDTSGDLFDSRTASAVDSLYAKHGYAAPRHDEPELPGLRQQLTEERNNLEMLHGQHDMSAKARDGLAAQLADPEAEDTTETETALQRSRLEHDQIHHQLDTVRSSIAMLEKQIAGLSARQGVMLPQGAAVFAASDRGLRLRLAVGDQVSQGDPVLVTSAGAAAAQLQLTTSQAELITPLIPVAAVLEVGDLSIDSTITAVSADGLSEVPLGAAQAVPGTPVRATVALDESGGAVLALPVTALTRSGDEWTVVKRRDSGTVIVPVEVGRDIGGWVELISGDLDAGDEVRVG